MYENCILMVATITICIIHFNAVEANPVDIEPIIPLKECLIYKNLDGDCLPFISNREGEGSYELCSATCLLSDTCVAIQSDNDFVEDCEHVTSLDYVENCGAGEFTVTSRDCFEESDWTQT